MRIGILEAGRPPSGCTAGIPTYCEMIRDSLGPSYTCYEFDVRGGVLPDPGMAEGYVITGSESGVYEGHGWIRTLREWLVTLDPAVPVVGICFGHQIMAEAYGGNVQRSARGWAGGLQEYRVNSREAWMDASTRFTLPVAHQDHVVVPPPRTRLIATNERCQYAALSYADRLAISFQGHPEFPVDYCAMLIDHYERGGAIDAVDADEARASLKKDDDRARVFGWIRQFLKGRYSLPWRDEKR